MGAGRWVRGAYLEQPALHLDQLLPSLARTAPRGVAARPAGRTLHCAKQWPRQHFAALSLVGSLRPVNTRICCSARTFGAVRGATRWANAILRLGRYRTTTRSRIPPGSARGGRSWAMRGKRTRAKPPGPQKSRDDGQDVGRHASGEASAARCPIAFSKRHSRTFTTLKAMDRIARHRASRASKSSERTPSPAARDDGTLRLLLVGADRTEGTCPRDTAAVFDGLLADAGKTNASESSSSVSFASSSSPPSALRRAMEGEAGRRRPRRPERAPRRRRRADVFHAVSRRRDDPTTTTRRRRRRRRRDRDPGRLPRRAVPQPREQDRKRRRDGDEPTQPPTTTTRRRRARDDTNDAKKRGTGTVGRRTRRR